MARTLLALSLVLAVSLCVHVQCKPTNSGNKQSEIVSSLHPRVKVDPAQYVRDLLPTLQKLHAFVLNTRFDQKEEASQAKEVMMLARGAGGHLTSDHHDALRMGPPAFKVSAEAMSQACTDFGTDLIAALSANYSSSCGVTALQTLATTYGDPTMFCINTGAATATSCGTSGLYAKASGIVLKYKGLISQTCQVPDFKDTTGLKDGTCGTSALCYMATLNTLGTMCIKDGNEYCWSSLGAMSSAGAAGLEGMSTMTKESLDQTCKPCYIKMIKRFFSDAADSLAGMGETADDLDLAEMGQMLEQMMTAMCTKDASGNYCMLRFNEVTSLQSSGEDSQPTKQQLEAMAKAMCGDPCIRKIFGLMMPGNLMDAYCVKDGSEYCIVKLGTDQTIEEKTTGIQQKCISYLAGGDSQSCSEDCASEVNKFLGDIGCCAEPMMYFMSQSMGGAAVTDMGNKLMNGCPNVEPSSCVKTYKQLTACFGIPNGLWIEYRKNMAQGNTLIAQDVAEGILYSSSMVNVVSGEEVAGTPPTVKVCVMVVLTDSALEAGFKTALEALGGTVMPSLNAVGGAAVKKDPLADILFGTVTVTSGDVENKRKVLITTTLPYTEAQFTASLQDKYKTAVAMTASVEKSKVKINKMTIARRRQNSLNVETEITAKHVAQAQSIQTMITKGDLNSQLTAAGVEASTGVNAAVEKAAADSAAALSRSMPLLVTFAASALMLVSLRY